MWIWLDNDDRALYDGGQIGQGCMGGKSCVGTALAE